MDKFFETDFVISKIDLAFFYPAHPGKNSHIHENRMNHGFAMHTSECDKYYQFDNGQTFHVTKNIIIFMPKSSNYVVTENIPGDCYAINFDMLNEIPVEPFVIKVKNTSMFLESFKKAANAWTINTAGHHAKCMRELYNIVYNINKEYHLSYVDGKKSKIIVPAIEYIHANYTKENISVPNLAKMCSISETYLRTIFLSSFGVSPVKYINDLKLSYASELLRSNMYSVHDAMMMSGFNDEAYFSRVFKKNFDVSPSEYIKQQTQKGYGA